MRGEGGLGEPSSPRWNEFCRLRTLGIIDIGLAEFQSVDGDVFVVVRPDIDAEVEKAIRAELVGILEEG